MNEVLKSDEVRVKQKKVDRLDVLERWVRLVGIGFTTLLVAVLVVIAVWQGGRINQLVDSNETNKCGLVALAQFAKGTAEFAATPPAPNTKRDHAVAQIKKSVPLLNAASRGKCVKATSP